jgi:hypothetical protein
MRVAATILARVAAKTSVPAVSGGATGRVVEDQLLPADAAVARRWPAREGLDRHGAGWVSTLLSFTTFPVASTTHTLDSAKNSSIPA